jgi:hypothetical protein
LKLLDFSNCSVLQEKVQVIPFANLVALHPSIAAEWNWLAAEYISKACHSFRHWQEATVVKNGIIIE